ncbi:UPF0149 family protein [Ectothiorhodospira mobilis]|uniref:UPF0149 family protein n=1 Tax=Ectothiorhodospira mobilis TaxID=195064 RepID=UPI0019038773|nr:UPF0149 family protein [Ectothiorhodospira mobilis]MBK1692450.1 YecA family protein [Ectothiorhodospira mobilis]
MMPGYEAVEDSLRTAGAAAGAAEVHGTLCGLLTANLGSGAGAWLREILPPDAGGQGEAAPPQALAALFEATRTQLADALLSFDLLLPPDDSDLERRVEALGLWCQGFLYGLALAGVGEPRTLPQDSAEIVRDLSEIARTGFSLDDQEEDEAAFQEIHEYVRVGVLLVSEELQPLKGPSGLH